MDLDLRRKCVHILRRICSSQTILPRSCILSENISKEGDIAFASGGLTDDWKGRHNGNRVCVKAFRAENLSKIKQVRDVTLTCKRASESHRSDCFERSSSGGDSPTQTSSLYWVSPQSCFHCVS